MNQQKLLSIPIRSQSHKEILEKIFLYMSNPTGFFHIVSINPENVVVAHEDKRFRKVLSEGDIQLLDGVGVVLGCAVLGIPTQGRISGSDFMDTLLESVQNKRLRVLLLGGKPNLAERLAKCYSTKYPNLDFKGLQGFPDIRNQTEQEKKHIFSIVADYKPQIILAAFGSPEQELWFWENKDRLKGTVCMGVGGGFDFAAGTISRAPTFLRSIGLEWLYRLIRQPWRWRRQMRLIQFVYLIFKQRFVSR